MGAWKTDKSGNVIGDFRILEKLDTNHYLVECVHCGEMKTKASSTITKGAMRCGCQGNRVKRCRQCKKEFKARMNEYFCSDECRAAYYSSGRTSSSKWKRNPKRTITEATRMLICVYSAEGETAEQIAKALNRTVVTVKRILSACKKNGKYSFYAENSPIVQRRLKQKRR